MGALRTPPEAWVRAGLEAMAAGGVDAVRVEAVAKSLGVTKGGFYGYFASRDALLEAMLDAWERDVLDTVLEQVDQMEGDLVEKARLAGRLTFSPDLLPIDLAVRQWARNDPRVAERLRKVDNGRMQLLRDAISTFRDDPEEVEAWCLLAFCTAFGHHFMAADHPGRSHDQVLARAADLILRP